MSKIDFLLEKKSDHAAGYLFSVGESWFHLSEFDAIELMVSILRAQSEIDFLRKQKPQLYASTKRLPLKLMSKKSQTLEMVLTGDIAILRIFGLDANLSLPDLKELCENIYCVLDEEYGRGLLDFKIFSPTYLEHMLGVDIPRIENVEYGKARISELFFFNRSAPKKAKIYEHDLYLKLKNNAFESGSGKANHLFESDEERMRRILSEISDEPEKACAVLYGNENVVRDGTHRLACLYFLHGDVEVPVIRLFVRDPFYSYAVYHSALRGEKLEIIR